MPQTALTIGNFDGVHLGHRALVERCRQHVGPSGRVVALAFDPHPNSIINPAKAPAPLTTLTYRRDLLLASGADEVLRLEPTPELLSLPPHDFIHSLVSTYSPTWFVEGDDFHFGKGRAGNVHTLSLLGSFLNFNVDVVEPQTLALSDHLVVKASSTLVRWLLANGRAADAALVLGRPYALEGTVTQGDRRGRTIGFPTANLAPLNTPPADGVYAALAHLPDGRSLPAMLNVGSRPTFNGTQHRTEVHIINAPTDDHRLRGIPEYDWHLRVNLIAWLRDQVRFPSPQALVAQLHRDRDLALWHCTHSLNADTSRSSALA